MIHFGMADIKSGTLHAAQAFVSDNINSSSFHKNYYREFNTDNLANPKSGLNFFQACLVLTISLRTHSAASNVVADL